eukprot:gene16410-7816_t
MDGQVEISFDILRAWELTNLYEKAYFFSVHVLLLFLGIYSIRKRACNSRARPSSTTATGSGDDHVARKSAGSTDKIKSQDGRNFIWANQLALWLLKNSTSYVNNTFDAWRSKMNGRLLSTSIDAKVHIEDIDKESLRFQVTGINSKQSLKDGQMNIAVMLHVEELKMQIQYMCADQPFLSTQLKLQSIASVLHIKLVNVNSKPKVSLCLDGFSINDCNISIEKEVNENDMAIIKDAFKKSLQNSVSLDITKGILKKEPERDGIASGKLTSNKKLKLKIEAKTKETQAEEDEIDETQRHIFVTDLDSAIAKVASEEANMRRIVISKRECRGPKIKIPSQRMIATPEITVQPATPLNDAIDQGVFIPKNPIKDDIVPSYLSLGEGETKCLETPVESLMSAKTDSDESAISNVVQEKIEATESDNQVLDTIGSAPAILVEQPQKTDVTPLEEVETKEMQNIQSTSLEEKQDAPSPSSSESSRDDRRRPRPRSLYELDREECDSEGDFERFGDKSLSPEKSTKSKLGRVNTFHLGSKSMMSIGSATSQWSLTSPVGYSPSKPSALVIEADELGKKRYFHVPPAVARKGTYEQHGVKLHVYSGHIFIAQHFNKPLPPCAVCSLPLARRMGKQGYQCRENILGVQTSEIVIMRILPW